MPENKPKTAKEEKDNEQDKAKKKSTGNKQTSNKNELKKTTQKKVESSNSKESEKSTDKKPKTETKQKTQQSKKKTSKNEPESAEKNTKSNAKKTSEPKQKKDTVKKDESIKDDKSLNEQEKAAQDVQKEVKNISENDKVKEEKEPQTEEEAAERTFAERDDEAIAEELANIKDLVQDEVNKILENPENGEWGELVKAARQEARKEKEEKIIPPEDLCECCGENLRDTSVSENNPYCEKCRENMKRYPFSISEIIMPILVVALLFLSSWHLSQTFATFKNVAEAQGLVKQGKLYSAVDAYNNLSSQLKVNGKNPGTKILENQVVLYDKIGFDYYETAENFISKNYAGENLDSFRFKKVKAVKNKIENFNVAYNAVGEVLSGTKDYDSFIKGIDKYVKEDEDKVYDKGLIEYWKYYAAVIFGQDQKVQLAHLKKMEALSPDYESIYIPALAEMYLNMGDFETMFKYCNKLTELNKEDVYSNIYKSIAYRLKGDLEKAEKAAVAGLKIDPTDPDINHQLSIIYLLESNPKVAVKYAKTAYENATSQYTYITNANVYALCAHLINDTETYTSVEEELVQYNSSISSDVIAIIEGTKTLQDVFLKDKGDVSWK